MPDTSNSGYETVTGQVRHYLSCSSVGTRSNAMCTHQDLISEPHSRISQRSAQDLYKRTFYILYTNLKDLTMIFIQELPMNIPEELSYKHQQSICKILMQGSLDASHKDGYEIMSGSLKGFPAPLQKLLTRNCKKDQNFHARTSRRITQNRRKEPAASSWHKNLSKPHRRAFIEAPLIHGICKICIRTS